MKIMMFLVIFDPLGDCKNGTRVPGQPPSFWLLTTRTGTGNAKNTRIPTQTGPGLTRDVFPTGAGCLSDHQGQGDYENDKNEVLTFQEPREL